MQYDSSVIMSVCIAFYVYYMLFFFFFFFFQAEDGIRDKLVTGVQTCALPICLELVRALEEADDIAVLGVRGHPVPGSRREGWRAGFDDGMEPLGHGAIRFRHLGNLREHVPFPIRLLRARASARFRLQLLGALLHCDAFLVRESLDRLAGHGGALGGLLCLLLRSHRASSYATPTLSKPITASVYLHRGNLGRTGVSTRDKRRFV